MANCLRYPQTAWLPTPFNALVIILLVLACFRGSAASNRIQVASAPAAASRAGAGGSFTPILSADGGHVAFISSAKDLVPNDNLAEYFDVFVRDLVLSNTVLVSVNLAGTAGGNDHSISPSVNSNAQMIAFASTASDLVSGDTNNTSDIFVRDLASARTLLVSLNLAGTGPGNGPSRKPSISRDGRFVVFESAASDLVANDANNASDVFVRDLALGTTTLVSLDSSGAGSANGASELLHVTPDARFIAFRSLASNVTDQAKTPGEVFVRDRELGITYWATVNLSSTNLAQPRRFLTALSDSCRYLALEEDLDTLGAGATVYRHDLWTGLTDQAQAVGSSYVSAPAISANGDRIAFAGDQVYIWELANAAETRGIFSPGVELSEIRVSADGHTVLFLNRQYPGSGFQLWTWEDNSAPDGRINLVSAIPAGNPTSGELRASFPNLSSDGNLIVFDGTPEDLVEGDWNKASDVFIRHMASGVTTLVSVRDSSLPPASTGTALTKLYRGSLSANGRQLVFTSQDNVLVPFDTNYWQDLFLRDLVAGTNRGVSGPLQLVPPLQGGTGPRTNSYIVQTNSALAPMISADGRFIAFDLSYAYPNSVTNSYRFDGSTGSVMRVALDINRQAREGYAASMSADGRWVVFQTREPVEVMNCCWQYLSQPDGNGVFDIVLRDFGDPFLAKPYPGYPDPAPLGIPVSTTAGNTVGNNASFQ